LFLVIEFEIKQQILRKEQEDHLNMLRLEEEKDRRDFYRTKKIKDLEERKKELQINLIEVNEIISKEKNKVTEKDIDKSKENEIPQYFGMAPEDAKDLIENNIGQIEDEIKRINMEEGEEKKRKKETKFKEAELFKKYKDFQDKSFKNYMSKYRKSFEIRKLEEIKEKERLDILEEKRLQKIKENDKTMYLHKKRFEETNNKMEEKLKKESEAIAKKLIISNENRIQHEESRKIALKKKVEIHLQKQIEIKNFLARHKENDEIKHIQLKRKMKEIEKQKQLFDKQKDNEIKERIKELNIKSIKTKESREQIQNEITKENHFTMLRIKNFVNKYDRKKEEIERENMFNCEKHEQKRNEVELKIKRNENVKEIERRKALEKIFEDYKKSEDFKSQKIVNSNKKRIISIELSNQRKNTLDKLDALINKYKEISVKNYFLINFYYF